MIYRAVWDNLSTSCSKLPILKISSLKDKHRQWLRIIPGTWHHFWQKDSKDAYFWYWKSRQKTVQVHHSSQLSSPPTGSSQRAWSWPPHVDWCPSLAWPHPCPHRDVQCPRWGCLQPPWSLAASSGTGSDCPGPALKNIKLNRTQNTRAQKLPVYFFLININFKKHWLTSQASCAFIQAVFKLIVTKYKSLLQRYPHFYYCIKPHFLWQWRAVGYVS